MICKQCGKIKKLDAQGLIDFLRKEMYGKIKDNYTNTDREGNPIGGVLKIQLDVGKYIINKSGYSKKLTISPSRFDTEIHYFRDK